MAGNAFVAFRPVRKCFRHVLSSVKISSNISCRLASTGKTSQHHGIGESTTHFGFQTVTESEKKLRVHNVFADVAKSYDLMNDVMSLGIHRVWKDILIDILSPAHGTKLLDMAGGSGDIAFRFLKFLKNQKCSSDTPTLSHVTVADINQNMLDIGKSRAERIGLVETNTSTGGDTINWVCADAEKLPFESNTFTAYTISFGVRNCTRINKVIEEAYRVLSPGGRFMCLEFSHLSNEYLQWAYDRYSFQVIPPMGQLLVGNWNAYQYLVESIRKFPKQDDFKVMIEKEGFRCVSYENLSFGIVSIHSGFKL